jgi:hypothetical protein
MARPDSERRRLLRDAVLSSIPAEPSQFNAVAPQFVYIPPTHMRALDPDAMVVAGIRGAGKSFWWHALQDQDVRALATRGDLTVSAGFGSGSNPEWPDKDELASLLKASFSPRLIWKAVVLRQVASSRVPPGSWHEVVRWVSESPSLVAGFVREADAALADRGSTHAVLFDALDTTADAWTDRQTLLRGLLELVLEFRSLRAIRAKVFVRPDMLEDPNVKAFPDASKVITSRVRLDWREADLYGLLFTYLGNASSSQGAEAFRDLTGAPWEKTAVGWRIPRNLRTNMEAQAAIFVRIAGPWMGTDKRRGKTYTWVPNHLSDAFGSASPRSFLAAIRRAAETPETEGQAHALHWSGLQDGVRAASEYRVQEIAEDLPWAHAAMDMLADVVVPCQPSALLSAWRNGGLTQRLEREKLRAPPEAGLSVIIKELASAGILAHLPDGRINIPDVYRVGFGLRRRGGFAPL